MIQLFDQWAETFAGLGLGVLNPVSCTVSEEAGGEYALEMDYPLDNEGLWKSITPLRIIVAPVQPKKASRPISTIPSATPRATR